MLLDDIVSAASFITAHTTSITLEEYGENELVRSAVERKFMIIGEALLRLQECDPDTAIRISDYQKIIGFRNRLAHGYDEEIDNALVWQVIVSSLPILAAEAASLLAEAE